MLNPVQCSKHDIQYELMKYTVHCTTWMEPFSTLRTQRLEQNGIDCFQHQEHQEHNKTLMERLEKERTRTEQSS